MSDVQTITHSKSGASFRIHRFGATVLSYKSPDGRENLFVSRDAKLDGSKAIRGGIPLVFPIFGPPKEGSGSTMPQHGFARNNVWTVKPGSAHDEDSHAGVALTLDLTDTKAGRGENNPWSESQAKTDGTGCRLTLDVKVDATSLTTNLVVENTGTDGFDFNMLQHTYLAVDGRAAEDKDQCHVHGLGGYSIIDKVDSSKSGATQSYDEDVTISGMVDKVHIHPEGHNTLKVKVGVGGGKAVRLEAYGEVADSPVPVSCVVWNPGKDAATKMGDFGDDQYQDMICVEPGLLGHEPVLPPGKEARLTQIIFSS